MPLAITAPTFNGGWRFLIDVQKESDLEQFEIDAWDAEIGVGA